MSTRIYVVTETFEGGTNRHLIRAISPAQAVAAVTKPRFTAEVAGQDELVKLVGEGVKVKDAAGE
ncbi:hypothetical protein [Arenimonas sp.]|uniref:hypothetical protein n=1 Tax=Arenimonas sp. TaxID=1872635 RepID=UPI0039E27EDF